MDKDIRRYFIIKFKFPIDSGCFLMNEIGFTYDDYFTDSQILDICYQSITKHSEENCKFHDKCKFVTRENIIITDNLELTKESFIKNKPKCTIDFQKEFIEDLSECVIKYEKIVYLS